HDAAFDGESRLAASPRSSVPDEYRNRPPHEPGRRAAPSKAEPRLRTPNWLSRHLECGGTTPLLTASLDSPPPPALNALNAFRNHVRRALHFLQVITCTLEQGVIAATHAVDAVVICGQFQPRPDRERMPIKIDAMLAEVRTHSIERFGGASHITHRIKSEPVRSLRTNAVGDVAVMAEAG